jgi:hypothetical protein
MSIREGLHERRERLHLRVVGPRFVRPPDPAVPPPGAGRAEVQARRALRWYPRSWREEHGEELVATVLDAARPGAARLSVPTRLDLAGNGLAQHRRSRPPWEWLLFNGASIRPVPPPYRGWVKDRLDSTWTPLVLGLSPALGVFLGSLAMNVIFAVLVGGAHDSVMDVMSGVFGAAIGGCSVAFVSWPGRRAKRMRKIGLTVDGRWVDTRPPPPDPGWQQPTVAG